MNNSASEFPSLEDIATHLRERLEQKKYVLLFAYNGTGKTRLSMAFKGGSVTGMIVAGLALTSVAGYYAATHDVIALVALGGALAYWLVVHPAPQPAAP